MAESETTQPVKFEDENGFGWAVINGKTYLRVTSVLGFAVANKKLEKWFKKNSERKVEKIRNDALKMGADLHDIYWRILSGQEPEVPQHYLRYVDSFRNWIEVSRAKPQLLEHLVWSDRYGIAGTFDYFGELDGKLVVADWKNARRYDITTGWQLAAYRICGIELGIMPDDVGLVGIQIDKVTANVRPFWYQHIDFVTQKFLCALEIFKGLYFHRINGKIDWPYLKREAVSIPQTGGHHVVE